VTARETAAGPLLSICVPTYNRAPNLRNLLGNLERVKSRFGADVEICVSNNCSNDGTAAVIAEFHDRLGLKVVHQATNIGGTLNIIAVAQLMAGDWATFVGDDDELDADSVGRLLDYLRGLTSASWVFVDAAGTAGAEQYFRGCPGGRFSSARFRRWMLRSTLQPFGFMGVHVFPRSALPVLRSLTLENSRPWPHIAAFLRVLSQDSGDVHVCKITVTVQARGGAKLFWTGGDLARIRIAKLGLIKSAFESSHRHYGFHHLIMLRELYSVSGFTTALSWKLYEGEDFNHTAVSTYFKAYLRLGACTPLAIGHALLVCALRLLPNPVYAGILSLIGKGALKTRYLALKKELGGFDGIRRGI
jgi:glycosyltransferase involved in cell wall biosynthesis